jgi:UDPglucose 6-dehydrogenase
MIISIIGLGFVGSAMYSSFNKKSIGNLIIYDKYKDGGIGLLESCLKADIIFLALPTQFNNDIKQYDKNPIYETCDYLEKNNYLGVIVIKSTVEPETTDSLSEKYSSLHFIHNPEFLTARTAEEDFHNQTHIVLGKGNTCPTEKFSKLKNFYSSYYPTATISECTALESESMKIYLNSFYAMKIQFFTELYLLCEKNNSNFQTIKSMMLKNNWINPAHTNIPGPDGSISYGGLCFPKDTMALNEYMEKYNTPHKLLSSTIQERNEIRKDNDNIK